MKNKFFAALFILSVTGSITAHAQNNTGTGLALTLKEAQEYAVRNNKMVISARLDVQASKAALWETISSGLVQVNTSGSFTDNLKLMTTLLPGDFFGKPGEYVPIKFGQKFNSSAALQASMLLFNAPYLVGVETSKLANKLSEQNLAKSEQDTREAVSMTYYLILISERSLDIIERDISNLNETLRSTKAMLAAGMAEQTDVDQMTSNVTMVENSRMTLERTIEVNYNLLRFQLGVTAETPIKLNETLESITAGINVDALMSQEFDMSRNISFKLMESQENMSRLMLKSQKATILPSIAGFYNYGTNGMGNKVSELRWFPNSMTGLQVSVPIFASGQRYASIRKAQINLQKSIKTKDLVSDQLKLQEKQYRYNLVNANLQYQTQKENIEVSKRVYTSTENKYKQGMASSLELTQANSLYLAAENNYISALMSLLQAKLALDKLLNNI
jgi:outer membrane protein TolC